MGNSVIARNNVRILGNGEQTMLFAHGFGCDQNMWRFVTPAFEKDYRIVLFDYVGCGKSDIGAYDNDRYETLDGYAQDVIDICEALDLRNAIFIGHSVSSMIGTLAAVQNPVFFKAMIFIGPSPCYINDNAYTGGFERSDLEDLLKVMDSNYLGWASFLAPVVMKNENQPYLVEELEASFCTSNPFTTKRFAHATFFSDNRRDLAQLQVPVLLLQCSDDSIAPESVGDYLSAHIKDSTLVKMKATGHCPHLSHPEETVAAIQSFLP